jgi:hypothetical protein
VHALCSPNEATVKRQTSYEDLRILKSVVKPEDFMLSLDVESAFFHVPIHPKHHKFFSSHLALPLFVKNKFIELQTGGYFVCSRPDLAQPMPSTQTPLHLRHLYHQVVEFSHAVLPLDWTRSPRIWTIVMSVVTAGLRRHGMRTLLYVDDLLIACSSFEEASRVRQIIEDTLLAAGIVRVSLKGCIDTPTQTLPDHLSFIISSTGKGALRVPERRCFALCRQARALLFEAANNRRLVDSDLLRCFSGAATDSPACQRSRWLAFISEKSSTRKSSTSQDLSSLKQLSTTCSSGATFPPRTQRTGKSSGQIIHLLPSTPTHRAPPAGVRCWSRPTRQRDRPLDGGRRKNCWK